MDSSCELLRPLDAARVPVHCCDVPCRTLRSTSMDSCTQRAARVAPCHQHALLSPLLLAAARQGAVPTPSTVPPHAGGWVGVGKHTCVQLAENAAVGGGSVDVWRSR
jgi:hypothetical protein